jgi:uncharacterized protein (DUF1330 family)
VSVDVHDADRYASDYAAFSGDTVAAHGGRFLVRGGATESLEGDPPAQRTVVIEFPSVQAAREWFGSDAYQALAKARRAVSEATLILAEGIDAPPS